MCKAFVNILQNPAEPNLTHAYLIRLEKAAVKEFSLKLMLSKFLSCFHEGLIP